MARLPSIGFELNSTTGDVEFTTAFGAPTIVSTIVRSGTYALRISSLSSGNEKSARYTFASANIDFVIARVYFNFATFPSATNRIIRLVASGLTVLADIRIDNSGVLTLFDEDGQIGSGSSALSTGVWYSIELKLDRTAAAGSHIVEARVNEAAAFATSSTRSLSAGVVSLRAGGNLGGEAQTTGDWFIDDIAINNSSGSFQNSWPGSSKIIHLKPNLDGDNEAWTAVPGSADNYTAVDEVTPDDITSYISETTNGDISDYNIEPPTGIGDNDTINAVQVGVRFRAAAVVGTQAQFVVRIKATSGGTVEESSNITASTTTWNTNATAAPRNYPLTLYDMPGASTTAWTKADLATAQIGVRLANTPNAAANVSTLWALVDYTPKLTFDAASSSNGTGTSLTFSHTVTAGGADRALFVGVGVMDSNDANRPVTGITYNGVAMTKVDDEDTGSGTSERAELWRLVNPATGANNVVISTTGSVSRIMGGAASFTNVDQTTPIDAFAAANGGSSPATASVTAVTEGAAVLDVMAGEPNITAPTTGQSLLVEQEPQSFETMGMSLSESADTGTARTHGYTLAYGARWRQIIAAIRPSTPGGGGGGTTVKDIVMMGIIPFAR